MRWLWVLPLVGCGRLAFDPRDRGNDAAIDDAVDSSVDSVVAIECTLPGYSQIGNSCYRLAFLGDALEVLWPAAEAACEADAEGAHLAIVDNAAEATMLGGMLGTVADAWVGTSDRKTEGTYLEVTGEPASFLGWGAAEPDGAGDCGKIREDGLADGDCALVDDYICEFDGRIVDPNAF